MIDKTDIKLFLKSVLNEYDQAEFTAQRNRIKRRKLDTSVKLYSLDRFTDWLNGKELD